MKYRTQYLAFESSLAKENILGLPGGETLGLRWVMRDARAALPGKRLIRYEGAFASGTGEGFSQDVFCHIRVEE